MNCLDEDANTEEDFQDCSNVPVNCSRMGDTKVYQLHRFNGQNFQLWKRQAEDGIRDDGL